ncbi:YciI family protein [Amycolatopsis sp. BJA-103]|uniref:YciI family protein n=1 Tax=Amycolatopsis sp. BJA-103 TaxID=1911175 RepID=UPI000C7721D5|nr:YciI family protein [Amycolatopsis sp. BJA-103]AUI61397.1 transcription initiation protein [Amycolatopsis sp. BJA-103]PNE21310.1 transcription initiation protein [Amycolatopsis sp. BJA-103]
MRYLLMLCGDVGDETPDTDITEPCRAWREELTRRGMRVDGMGLHAPESATTVRVRDGKALLTDGPFAETKEQIGGITVLDCESREQAVEAAKSHPWAAIGTIEVREML